MNANEPVAYRHWMIDEEFPEDSCWEYFDAPTGKDCKECIPLYTHPVKELTDKITEQEKFIKAILKKGGCDGNICQKYNANPVKELTDEEIELIKKFQDERDKLKAEMPKVFAEGKRLGIIETENRFSKAMSMTNEEILSLWDWNSGEILATDLLDFADAILRKASEK